MKIIAAIAGGLLGLMFVGFSLLYFFGPPPPDMDLGPAAAAFMTAMAPTGYLTFVKLLEITGGLLVAVPKTRNIGLLVLGPIIINIWAFHIFITGGTTLRDPFNAVILGVISLLALVCLWAGRRAFEGLIK